MNKPLSQYQNACNRLAKQFVKDVGCDPDDMYWIMDKVGEVLNFSDYFVNMHNIVDYYLYDYTPDELFEWIERNIDTGVNMKAFKYLNSNTNDQTTDKA